MSAPTPTLWRSCVALWQWRARVRGSTPAFQVIAALLAAAAGLSGWSLQSSPEVRALPQLSLLLLLVSALVVGILWGLWPVASAGVDDSAELQRYALLPIPPRLIYGVSLLQAMVEPRTWPGWALLVGESMSYRTDITLMKVLGGILGAAVLALLSQSWGRVWVHMILRVLRSHRAVQTLGGGAMLALLATALIPPPDLSWLGQLATGDVETLDWDMIQALTLTCLLLPTSALATVAQGVGEGDGFLLSIGLVHAGLATLPALILGWSLLTGFHQRAGRALPQPVTIDGPPTRDPLTLTGALVGRELRDLSQNPRLRWALVMPFLLLILLRLVGARPLAQTLFPAYPVDAALLAGLSGYAVVLLLGVTWMNHWGFDGPAAQSWFLVPLPVRRVLTVRLVVQGLLATAVALLVLILSVLLLGVRDPSALRGALLALPGQVLLLLLAGLSTSVWWPRREQLSLRRRTSPPALAVVWEFGAAALALGWGQFLSGRTGIVLSTVTAVILATVVTPIIGGLVVWATGWSARRASTNRAFLLRAVARGEGTTGRRRQPGGGGDG